MSHQTVLTVKHKMRELRAFYEYAYELEFENIFSCVNYTFAVKFKRYLDENVASETTRYNKWMAAQGFCEIFDSSIEERPFCDNPYRPKKYIVNSEKYIPQYVLAQSDSIFQDEKIPVHIRLIYWILRLIPSRISEVCGIEWNCLNMFNGMYVLFIPTWKQNGGYKRPQMRCIYLKCEGICMYLIDLIRRQQAVSQQYQRYLHEERRGMLFTYRMNSLDGSVSYRLSMRTVKIVDSEYVNSVFNQICDMYDVKDEDGNPYRFTSHQFRHVGITDRLEYGFTPEQVRLMTAHQGEMMILTAYNHISLNKEYIAKVQKAELGDAYNARVLFQGRILGMDAQQEQRILHNIRAQRVRGGICSDITGCQSDMLSCCECEHFVIDSGQLEYFEEQLKQWEIKLERFSAFPIIKDNAEKNISTYETLIAKIKSVTGGERGE